MVTVKFFGTARVKFKEKQLVTDQAETIGDLMKIVADRFGVSPKDIKQFLIYVNWENITKLKMYRTKLNDGDVIMLLSPASGG